LVRIYTAATKEKNYQLYLDCLDPILKESPLALELLRFYWDISQKNLNKLFVHVDPFEVGEIAVIQGENIDEESDDAFFLDEKDKEDILAHSDDLVEELHVATRRFNERGKQVGSPRDIILRRYKGGRWYIFNGLVL